MAFVSCVIQYSRAQPRARATSSTARDQRPAYPLTAHVGGGEQVLQVADIGPGRARMEEEVRDADQPAVDPGAESVQLAVGLELPPGPVVHLLRLVSFVERDVAAEQLFPGLAVRWL